MTKPPHPPHLPDGLPCTPRVASVHHLRAIIPDFEFPLPSEVLAEVLPFGVTPMDNGVQWVAVRVTADFLLGKASASTCDWMERSDFDALVPLRSLLIEPPATAEPFCDAELANRVLLAPSSRTLASSQPHEGVELLDAWRCNRAPVMKTLAWLHHACRALDEEHVVHIVRVAHDALASGGNAKLARPLVVKALELTVPVVCEWLCWPSSASADPSVQPSIFDELAATMGLPDNLFEILANEPFEGEEDADDWLPPDDWPWDPEM